MPTRIETRGTALRVVNLLIVTSIDAGLVTGVRGTNGIEITYDGGSVKSIAYGQSNLQAIVASKRCRRVASSIEAWVTATRVGLPPGGRLSRRFRWEILAAAAAAVGLAYAYLVLLWFFLVGI